MIQHGSEANIQPAFQQFSNMFITADKAGLPDTFVQSEQSRFQPRAWARLSRDTARLWSAAASASMPSTSRTTRSPISTISRPLSIESQLSRSLLISQNVNVNSLFTFQNPTANGSTANAAAALAAIGGFSDTYPTMKAYTGNLTVEKDLGHGTSRARQLSSTNDSRQPLPRRAGQRLRARPGAVPVARGQRSDRTQMDRSSTPTSASIPPNGTSNFHSGEIEFTKRFSGGLLFDVNYAHSRLLALAPTATNPVAAPTWSYDYGPNAAPSRTISSTGTMSGSCRSAEAGGSART